MRYCVTFVTGVPDWQSEPGWYAMDPKSFSCEKTWVTIESAEFAQLQERADENQLYPAITALFVAFLAALSVIWGAKQIYSLLVSGGGKDD